MSQPRQPLLPGVGEFVPNLEQIERVDYHLAHAPNIAWWIPKLDRRVIRKMLLRQGLYWRKVVICNYVKGKVRTCWSPNPVMRNVHKVLRNLLKWRHGFPAVAFHRGDSILLNARCHLDNRSSYMIDLTNAYETITTRHVQLFLQREHRLTTSEAWVVSRLLTLRGKVRQGAPISGELFNAMMRRADLDLLTMLEAPNYLELDEGSLYLWHVHPRGTRDLHDVGYIYSRYADDLCFSSPGESFDLDVCRAIRGALMHHGFEVNDRKTILSDEGHLRFPGVEVKRKRIEPDGMYIFRLAEQLRDGTLSPWQKQGHLAYLKGFGQEVFDRTVKFHRLEI